MINGVFHAPAGRHEALCLLANPRPFQPSFSCPVGCPHHVQEACRTRNCVWGNPNATYVHPAARECVVECARSRGGALCYEQRFEREFCLRRRPAVSQKRMVVARRRPAQRRRVI